MQLAGQRPHFPTAEEEKHMKDVMENVRCETCIRVNGPCTHIKNKKYEVIVQNDGDYQWIAIKELPSYTDKVFVFSNGDVEVDGKKVKKE